MGRCFLTWWIYLFGIRFYETAVTPISSEVIRSEFKTVRDHVVKFIFFRETYHDVIFRHGLFFTTETHAFILQAQFDENLFGPAMKFNNTKYLFKGIRFPWFKDLDVADALLGVYLKFIERKII